MEKKNRIKELRKKAKLTQYDLAEIIGISQPYIAMIENGERPFDTDLMDKISKALRVKPYELLPKEWQPDEITPEEQEILRIIRKSSTTQTSDNSSLPPQADCPQNPPKQTPVPTTKTRE